MKLPKNTTKKIYTQKHLKQSPEAHKMAISSFISSILVLALGVWAYLRLESSMNLFAENQLLIEPSKFSFKMWKDMPVSMYQSFTFFNLTNWNQVKSMGHKPHFVEVGPYVYKTIWSKSDVNFLDDEKLVSFAEKKQWHFQAHLSHGYEDDLIWTINTPLMTALALIQNAPVITRNIVSVILDGLGEGAFIKRPIRSLLFEGYSDLIVSVGPLFDRRFANFNGKFAYLYNKNDTIDGHWTVSTGVDDLASLNKIARFQSSIVNMTSFSSGQMPQGLNEVKAECAPAWSLDQSTNGQLFAPFNRDVEQAKLQRQLQQLKAKAASKQQQNEQQPQHQQAQQQQPQQQPQQSGASRLGQQLTALSSRSSESIVQAPKRFFSRISSSMTSSNGGPQADSHHYNHNHLHQAHQSSNFQQQQPTSSSAHEKLQQQQQQLRDAGKFIFYPDLCRPIHLLAAKQQVISENGIQASRYFIDPRVFMNSSQMAPNKCYEMNPRPPLANALAATINSVTGANVNVPNLVSSASSPFALFIPPNIINNNNNNHHHHQHHEVGLGSGLFERANHPNSFLNNALHSLSVTANQAADQLIANSSANSPISRLGRVRQLFSNIVSQRMSANPLLPSFGAGPAGLLLGNNHHAPFHLASRSAVPDLHTSPAVISRSSASSDQPQPVAVGAGQQGGSSNTDISPTGHLASLAQVGSPEAVPSQPSPPASMPVMQPPVGASDRWVTQFRFKWPRGVFSIGQCQLGAPIYVSLPHFLDADEYYLEQVEGLKPNRSLHEFYIDVESTLHSIPVNVKARLQLNVATPELRFRNIPNAMIPVLWQEVTFKMDKPVATLLYWSFTMSATIYKIISMALIMIGLGLLVVSSVGGLKSRRDQRRRLSSCQVIPRSRGPFCDSNSHRVRSEQIQDKQRDHVSCSSGSHLSDTITSGASSLHQMHHEHNQIEGCNKSAALIRQPVEGRRSSWQHIILPKHSTINRNTRHQRQQRQLNSSRCHDAGDSLDELKHGASLNAAYASSCNEIHLDCRSNSDSSGQAGSDESIPPTQSNFSPKHQAWSRASSHCELVSSLGTLKNSGAANCSGCLFACLRHPMNEQKGADGYLCSEHNESFTRGSGDISNRVVRHNQQQQQQSTIKTTSSDTEKTTLSSSRSSNLDSASSIYTAQRSKKSRP